METNFEYVTNLPLILLNSKNGRRTIENIASDLCEKMDDFNKKYNINRFIKCSLCSKTKTPKDVQLKNTVNLLTNILEDHRFKNPDDYKSRKVRIACETSVDKIIDNQAYEFEIHSYPVLDPSYLFIS
ncbi:hypothetical protein ACFL1H_05810 [Nanoarchaeota archaeon]